MKGFKGVVALLFMNQVLQKRVLDVVANRIYYFSSEHPVVAIVKRETQGLFSGVPQIQQHMWNWVDRITRRVFCEDELFIRGYVWCYQCRFVCSTKNCKRAMQTMLSSSVKLQFQNSSSLGYLPPSF